MIVRLNINSSFDNSAAWIVNADNNKQAEFSMIAFGDQSETNKKVGQKHKTERNKKGRKQICKTKLLFEIETY